MRPFVQGVGQASRFAPQHHARPIPQGRIEPRLNEQGVPFGTLGSRKGRRRGRGGRDNLPQIWPYYP